MESTPTDGGDVIDGSCTRRHHLSAVGASSLRVQRVNDSLGNQACVNGVQASVSFLCRRSVELGVVFHPLRAAGFTPQSKPLWFTRMSTKASVGEYLPTFRTLPQSFSGQSWCALYAGTARSSTFSYNHLSLASVSTLSTLRCQVITCPDVPTKLRRW